MCRAHYVAWHRAEGPVGPKPGKSCSVEECTLPYRCKGYCRTHYRAWQRHGDPLGAAAPWRSKPCSVDGCDKPNSSKGLCNTHDQRLRTRGHVGNAGLERDYQLVHGTADGYKHHGCRCDECREARRFRELSWRAANRDSVRQAQARVRAQNPERVAAYRRKWKRTNPDKVREYTAARVYAPFDAEALAYCELVKNDPCVYCGEPSSEIDHIVPVSVSRSSDWTNLAPACDSCNSSKGAKSLLDFLAYRKARLSA